MPSAALDQCAQELQDRLGTELLVQRMRKYLTPPSPLPPLMARRPRALRSTKTLRTRALLP